MAVVLEPSGAQVLPNIKDERQTVSSHAAYLCVSADLRAVAPVYRDLASRLSIHNHQTEEV